MSEPTKAEIEELEAAAEPVIDGKARHRDRLNRKKLEILNSQVQRHCKAKNLQVLIFSEGLRPGDVMMGGYFSSSLVKSLVMNLRIQYKDLMDEALRDLAAIAEAAEGGLKLEQQELAENIGLKPKEEAPPSDEVVAE